jgi:hypothetical protein
MISGFRTLRAAGAALALCLVTFGPAPTVAATPEEAPPLAAGQSRVWFLRQLLPGTQFHPPMVYVNGAPIGVSAEGTAFYRDFAPGQYVFTVENCIPQARTSQTLNLRPGAQFALEVTSDENASWDCVPAQVSYLRQVQPQQVPYLFSQVSYAGAR